MAKPCLPLQIMAVATALLLVMLAVPVAIAVDYQVGGNSGWDSGVNYDSWAKGKTFNVGDALVFKYGSTHTVDVVGKEGYDNCDPSKATNSFSDGNTRIELKNVGLIYFICPTPGHCPGGMKLSIDVKGSTSGGSPPSTPSPPSITTPSPSAPSPPTATDTPPAPSGARSNPPPNAATQGIVSYVMVAVSIVLGYVVA